MPLRFSAVVPNFTLKNQNDEEVCFYDALEETEQGIIIFAYPKANTPGIYKS